jgi:predicted phosphodiesterase
MRVLIVSDIHGNYYALKAVTEKVPFDVIVCSGDLVVDYPFPRECIDYFKEKCPHICMGNNDYAVAYDTKSYDKLPPKYLRYADEMDRVTKLTIDTFDEGSGFI